MKTGKYMKKSPVTGIALALVLVLLLGCGIGGTIAWLTAESEEVTNTFAVGKIAIDLNEHELGDDGELTEKTTKVNNNDYKVVPGTTQKKDPFVTVEAGSEECYVYVTVTNNLMIGNKTVATLNVDETKWVPIATSGNTTLYRYHQTVDASEETADKVIEDKVFTTVTYSGADITKDNINQLENKTIVIKAYAYQTAGVDQANADVAVKVLAGIS